MSRDVNIFKYQSRPVVYLCAFAYTPARIYVERFLLKYVVIIIISYTSVSIGKSCNFHVY